MTSKTSHPAPLDLRAFAHLPAEGRVALRLRDELDRGVRTIADPITFDGNFALSYGCPDEATLDAALRVLAQPSESFDRTYRYAREWTAHIRAFERDPEYRLRGGYSNRSRSH